MKLHLPVLLRKALLACFSVVSVCTLYKGGNAAAADLTLGDDTSLIIDYADTSRITDLDGGILTLAGGTELLLSNCGAGDGKTYTLLTGVSGLLDEEGNAILLDSTNNAVSFYFDDLQPGTGFWATATLVLTPDGSLQLVRHNETVKASQNITTRQTSTLVYNYYEGISFKDIAYSSTSYAWGGAIYGEEDITLSNNGSVTFSGNTASSSSAWGGAICGDTITLSNNGSVTFNGNTASSSFDSAYGGAIHGSGIITLYGSDTITLSNNGSVTFTGNTASSSYDSAYGGAICGDTITLSNNVSVTFSGNSVSSSATFDSAYGGAIDGDSITLSNNGSVLFDGNTATATGSSSYAYGGAIYGDTITLSNNVSVTFSGNSVSSSSSSSSHGGAIYGDTITLSNNVSVTISGNTAAGSSSAYGGVIYGDSITLSNNGSVVFDGNTATATGSSSYAYGGAIYGDTITLSNNGSVTFSGNSVSSSFFSSSGGAIHGAGDAGGLIIITDNALGVNEDGSAQQLLFENNYAEGSSASGGAIYAGGGSALKINNNGETIFRGNYAYATAFGATGGAIQKQPGIFSIQNNASVVFDRNYTLQDKTLRLQSIYAFGSGSAVAELLVNFSAPEGGKIEFRDSIYIDEASNSSSAFHLNDWYVNDAGEQMAQTGDIIFTGEDATAENLKAILAEHGIYREATEEEIRLSKTSEVWGTMQLHDGRLIVRDGAIIQADGITVYSSVSGKSTPTLWLDNGELSRCNAENVVTIAGGSALRLSGQNTARYSTLTLSVGSTLIIDVAAAHATTAALTLDSSTLTLGGAITLQLNAAEGLTQGTSYQLLTGITSPSSWTSDNVTVKSGTEGWNVGFADLTWDGNTLWLYYDTRPALLTATWTNEAGNRLWDTSSVNWEQDDIDYEYKNGVHVIFGDEGAGTVTLVGTLSPASVLVNSSEDYSFEGSGSLTGGMKLTKQGSGTLSISTANSYTGGTTIEAGTVAAKHAQALGTGVFTLAGGTLEIAVAGVGNTITNTGTSTLKVAKDITHILTGTVANSGELTFSGEFQTSGLGALSTREPATYENAAGEVDSTGGFSKSAILGILLTSGSGTTVNSQATIWHGEDELTLGSDGWATMGGEVSYVSYYVGSDHNVELNDIISAAVAKGISKTDIQLNGGILKANAELTGILTAEGTSEIIADNWAVKTAFSNSGTLSISGTVNANAMDVTSIGATHIDASGADSLSGFTKDAGSKFTLVNLSGNGSIVDPTQVSIDRNGTTYLLGANGEAVAEGATHYDNYLVGLNRDGSRHEVELDDIISSAAAKGISKTDIQLSGGILKANAELTGILTAEGTSEIIADNWAVKTAFSNSGTLSISGTVNANAMDVTSIDATHIDASRTDSLSGFTKDAGSKFTLVNLSGNGSIVDPTQVTIDRNGTTYLLGANGEAVAEGATHYDNYLVGLNKDGSRHEVELDDIISSAAAKGVNSTNIQLSGGILKANAALTGILTAEGTSEIIADNWAVKTAFSNSGALSISGTIDANAMDVTSIGATHIDASGADSLSGFTKDAGSKFTLVNLSGNGSIVDPTQVSIDRNGTTYLLGANGEAVAEGATHYDNYLVGLNRDGSRHEVELDDIISSAAAKGISKTDIQLSGGILKANAELTGILTAEGTSEIIADNWAVKTAFSNSGALSISGTIDANAMDVTSIGATHIDASGADSLSGFTKDAGSKFTLVNLSGNGSIVDPTQVSIDRNGTTYLLGANGEAVAEGATHYDNYLVGLNRDGSRHEVELDDIISSAAAKGFNSTNIQLSGGILTANAALTGVLTAEGTSEIIADNWSVKTAFSNSGTLSISGTVNANAMDVTSIGATHIDASGADSLSGFTKDAGSKFTLVNLSGNGSIVDPTQVSIDRNGTTYLLGANGEAVAEGATHYDNYLVGLNKDGSRHEVELDDIISSAAAKGFNSTNIQLSGGILTANAALTGVLTAEGTSEIIADNWSVKTAFSNSGTLSISGTVNANAMDVTSIGATHIDASGADSLSGFTKDAGSKFTLVNLSGNGSIVDPTQVSIDRNGTTYFLGANGEAVAEGATHYDNYLVGLNKDGSRHEVELDDIISSAAAKGVNSTNIQLSGGILTANAALTGVLTAEGTSEIIADNWSVKTAFSNSGTLSISGTVNANAMDVTSIGATHIDASGADSLSGFTKDAGSKFTLVNLSGNGSIVDPTQVSIDRNGTTYLLGANGEAVAEGATHYDNYLVGLNKDGSRHEVELDDIISSAAAKGFNSTNIQLSGGILTANAALTGVLTAEGTSEIIADNWAVKTAFSNSGTLSISGTIDASALDLVVSEAGRVALNGKDVGLTESGFARAAGYSVLIVEGGKTVNEGVSISHAEYRMRSELVLGEDGVARAGGGVDYSRFYLTGADAVSVSGVDAVSEAKGSDLLNVIMDGGVLEVDADITVDATGGSIVITDDSVLRGTIADTDITAGAGDYTSGIAASISGGSKVTVDGGEVTLSGVNNYTGGTLIDGGCLIAGSDTAFGTGVIELNKGELNLNGKAAANDLLAKGGIISGGSGFRGAVVFNGAVGLRGNLSASAVTINQGSILTLNGSTISVSGSLTLAGDAVLNLNGSAFGAGDVLITFGSLSGSEELLTVDYGADSDKYTVEREGNSLILAWLEETQPEEEPQPEPLPPTKPEIPAPVLDRESCDALVQSSWGVFTASHAFADTIGGQRSAAGYVGGGRSTAWVSALGGLHRIDGSTAASGSDIDLYGAAVGLEHFMTELDSVGFAVGNVCGDVKLKQSGRETEQTGMYVGVYGTHLLAGFDRSNWLSLKWSAVYGDTTTEGTVGQEEMSWKQDSVQLNARAEWTSQLNYKWALSVFGGVEYFASDSAENESGDSLRGRVTEEEERVRMGSIQNLRGELGIGTRYTDGSTTLYGEVRYLNDMVRSNPYADINGLRGYGANPGRQGIGLTVGAQQELGDGWSVSAGYSLEAMSEATMHSANIGAGLRF